MEKTTITLSNQRLTILCISSSIVVTLFRLPNTLAQIVGNDAWLVTLLGGIYPIFLLSLGYFMAKLNPRENILKLSKKFFGRTFGTILNFVFISGLFFYTAKVLIYNVDVFSATLSWYLSEYKLVFIFIVIALYSISLGFEGLIKFEEYSFWVLIIVTIIPLFSILRGGSIYNLLPIFQSNSNQLLKGILSSINMYMGFEIFFLYYPYLKNKDNKELKGILIKTSTAIIVISTLMVGICIFCLGSTGCISFQWPLISTVTSIRLPQINNVTYIFMSLWILISLKTVSVLMYTLNGCLNNDLNKNKINFTLIFLIGIIYFLIKKLYTILLLDKFTQTIFPFYIIFNCLFVTIITIISFLKGRKKNESS